MNTPERVPGAPAGAAVADVCLILEGTYPYVQGGVSSWVHQIVTEIPEVTFALFFLGSTREQAAKKRYTPPPNVVSLTEVFLFEKLPDAQLVPGELSPAQQQQLYGALRTFYFADTDERRSAEFWQVIDTVDGIEAEGGRVTFGNLTRDEEAWMLLTEATEKFAPEESFIDFFWACRFVHLPVWIALSQRHLIPKARVYHSVSTGYAGMLGALAARRHRTPYLITEHGIYTKERIAEISQASWIYDPPSRYFDVREGMGAFKQFWINLFMFLGQVSYAGAHRIVSLFEGNTYLQIEFGAEARRLEVIPNGIDPTKFDAALEKRRARLTSRGLGDQIVVGFIGRVVPIKDVKTLIRAARTIVGREPRAVFHIIGPTEEDPDYFEECKEMVRLMGLEQKVLFLGPKNVREILSDLDVCLLTSISEGLPLIILEAFAAGVPCVATDVGACRELIFGRTPEDKAIGRAGLLTKICSPLDTADAVLRVVANAETLLKMGQAGRTRAEQHYRQSEIMGKYRQFYTDHRWSEAVQLHVTNLAPRAS
jgi:glycosyltransferase involved in cell wall biosynthesis